MKILSTFLLSLLASFAIQAIEEKPNFIIIIADDLNDAVSGIGGHPQTKTPNIERVKNSGVQFINAACNVPLCGPSRASMWSGIAPHTSGYFGYKQQVNRWDNNEKLNGTITLFQHMVKNGYTNFSTGKIHHNGHEKREIFNNLDGSSGFGHEGNFGPIPWDGKEETKQLGVLPPWMPEYTRKNGSWGDGFGPIEDLKQYGPEYRWKMFYNSSGWEYREGSNRDLMPDEICAQDAVQFLEQKHEQPFFLTVGFTKPHSPWYAPKKYFESFPLESLKLVNIKKNDSEDCSKILVQDQDISQPWGWQKYDKITKSGGDLQLLKWTQAYLACVAFMDDQLGKILDSLENSPYKNNTYVIFTSDHGYHMGEKDYLFKFSPWEESARIPLLVQGPNIPMNQTVETPVSLLDIYPTITDLAGISSQPNKLTTKLPLDGYSMRPLLENPMKEAWEGKDFTITAIASKEPVDLNKSAPNQEQHYSVRTKRHRYIYCRNGEEELYDHKTDPNEWTNIAKNIEQQKILISMRSRLSTIGIPLKKEIPSEL